MPKSQIHVHRLPGAEPEARTFDKPPKLFTPTSGQWAGQLCMMIGENRFVSLSGNATSSYRCTENIRHVLLIPFLPSEGITIVVTEE